MTIFTWRVDQPTFGDNSECSLSTNEQLCSIEASGRLSGSSTSLNYFARWEYDCLYDNVRNRSLRGEAELTTFRNHSALAVPYLTAFARLKGD